MTHTLVNECIEQYKELNSRGVFGFSGIKLLFAEKNLRYFLGSEAELSHSKSVTHVKSFFALILVGAITLISTVAVGYDLYELFNIAYTDHSLFSIKGMYYLASLFLDPTIGAILAIKVSSSSYFRFSRWSEMYDKVTCRADLLKLRELKKTNSLCKEWLIEVGKHRDYISGADVFATNVFRVYDSEVNKPNKDESSINGTEPDVDKLVAELLE